MATDDTRARLTASAKRAVARGVDSASEIVESLCENYDEELPGEELLQAAMLATTEALSVHLTAEEKWPALTDCDRLDRAFDALEREHITALHHFTCCLRCGLHEVGEHMADGDSGFTFYHSQDTDQAVGGGGLSLAFGGKDGSPEAGVEIACRVVDALEHEGLQVTWDGTFAKRIWIQMDWKRRRPH